MPDKSAYTPLRECLACGGDDLRPFLDLGAQPLANSFLAPLPDPHPGQPPTYAYNQYPLAMAYCGQCRHCQITIAVDPAILYADYAYASGTSATLRQYFKDFVARVESEMGCPPTMRVLEIASNDGSLMKEFAARGHSVVGVDPAANLAPSDMTTVTGLWNAATMAEAMTHTEGKGFHVIVAQNVLGHVADPAKFLALCKLALAPEGRIYIQTSQARMLENGEFDTVYHEHLSYFTRESWYAIAARVGLFIDRMDVVDIHGGSWLVQMTDSLDAPRVFTSFDWRMRASISAAQFTVGQYQRAGYRVVGYGAAAKGMTFLNAVKAMGRSTATVPIEMEDAFPAAMLGAKLAGQPLGIECIIDDSPLKVGRLCPGTGIPVVGSDVIPGLPEKTLFVILAWNFREEIVRRILRKAVEGDALAEAVADGKIEAVTLVRAKQFKFLTVFPAVAVS